MKIIEKISAGIKLRIIGEHSPVFMKTMEVNRNV